MNELVETKVCTVCLQPYPLGSFGKHRAGKLGLRAACKACHAVSVAQWRAKNPEVIKATKAAYYVAHAEEIRAYLALHREDRLAKKRAHDLARVEEERARRARYRAANREKIRAQQATYHAKNTDKAQARLHARRARLRGAVSEHVILKELFARDKGICGICKARVFWHARDPFMRPSHDHIVPISKGGDNTYANAQLAHRRCNVARGNRGAAQLRMSA